MDDDDYSGSGKNSKNVKEANIKNDFKSYCNKKTNKIDQNGMEKMGKTLDINIYEDIFITFFFFRCDCKNIEEVSEEEYVRGLKAFGFETLAQLKPNIVYVREVLLDLFSNTFKEFYQFLFRFNMAKKTKTISIEIVEVYFKELFGLQFTIVDDFLNFIIKVKKLASLTKDQWDCFLDFLLNQGSNFPENYNCDEYYPLLFDEYFHWYLNAHGLGEGEGNNGAKDTTDK